MNKLILLFGVLICLIAVQARHYVDKNEQDSLQEEETLRPKDRVSHRRRRRWQSSYGYDYPPPSYYYPDRRDDRNNQEVLQNIQRLLEEIATTLRRTPPPPPPQPQPIYIPYPGSFPTQVACTSQAKAPENSSIPTPGGRIHGIEDPNQIWGSSAAVEENEGYNGGARPISFEPIAPKQIMKRPSPQVEHGSEQVSFSTEAPKFVKNTPILGLASKTSPSISSLPGMCNAAILSCCSSPGNPMQQKKCFANIGCATTYADGNGCNHESFQKALKSFQAAYAPL